MPKITYIEISGKSQTIKVANGLSVMEGAVQNDIPGIDADCGGGMACATCHVYVKEEWFDKLPKKEDGEEDMLDMAYEPKKNSRLSCQLIVSDELDGLTVSTPSKQG
jgi:2Fe-2S ferredoxin